MLSRLVKLRARLQKADQGATAVEYGLMIALIAGVIMGVVTLLGTNLSSLFTSVAMTV